MKIQHRKEMFPFSCSKLFYRGDLVSTKQHVEIKSNPEDIETFRHIDQSDPSTIPRRVSLKIQMLEISGKDLVALYCLLSIDIMGLHIFTDPNTCPRKLKIQLEIP